MSAVVCRKRSFFHGLQARSSISASPPVSKKLRSSSFSTSPLNFDQLRALFPDMDSQLLEKALEESGNDLDAAISSLHELRLGHSDEKTDTKADGEIENGMKPTNAPAAQSEDNSAENNFPADGAEWVGCFVREMMTATSIDDARARATRLLESLEKCISSRAGAEAAQNFHKENTMLKAQIEVLLRDNAILKKAVAIQHERQKEYDERNQELQQLKQLIAQGKEQLRTLESFQCDMKRLIIIGRKRMLLKCVALRKGCSGILSNNNNITSEILQVDLERIECTQTLPRPRGGRGAVSKRPSAQVQLWHPCLA